MRISGGISSVLGLAATAFCVASSHADVLYLSLPDYTQTSFQSTSNAADEWECSPFTVSANATAAQVKWWGNYFNGSSPGTDSFTVGLYPAGPGDTAIASSVATSLTVTDLGFVGVRSNEEYQYTADISSPFAVIAGQQYELAILNQNINWEWQFGQSGTNYFRTGGDGNAWQPSGFPVQDAFELDSNTGPAGTPEPGTPALMLGLVVFAGAACFRLRMRKLAV